LDWLLRGTRPGSGVPPVFVIGVVMMVAVVGGLVLRSQQAAGSAAAQQPAPFVAGSPFAGSSIATQAVAGSSSGPGSNSSPFAATAGAQTPSPSPEALPSGYSWPLDGAMITLPFGPTDWGQFIVDGKKFHDGLDMATECGDQVLAAHDGIVLAAGREYDAYLGWNGDIAPYYHLLDRKKWWNSLPITIVIDDGNGYRSIYAHEYQVAVKVGQHVKTGQTIGYEGATGNASGCHVHFGLFKVTETATFALDPAVAKRMSLPAAETARIDPLLVLPFRCEVEEMRPLRPAEASSCQPLPKPTGAAKPSPKPSPKATPTPAPSASPTASS
jgi:murein DD-endopeptidase MepM/ murein hydrolase activator NlpD